MILAALVVADLGMEQSRAFVADEVWANFKSDIEARFTAKGYQAAPVLGTDAEKGIERRCMALADVWTWLDTLNPGDD